MTYITMLILSLVIGVGLSMIFVQLHPRHRNLKKEEREIESRRINAEKEAKKKANDLYNRRLGEIESKENDLNSRIVDLENEKAALEQKKQHWKKELKDLQEKSTQRKNAYAQLKKDIKKSIDILNAEEPNVGYALRILNKAYKRKLHE